MPGKYPQETVVSWKIHRKSECVMTVVPTLAAASQADYEVSQPRPPDYRYTDSSGWLESLRIDTPEGSSPAEIKISRSPDTIQTEISATSMEMTGGSPPAEIRISKSPDRLQTEISVMSTEMAGGSPPADIDICEGPDRLQTEISTTSTEMAGGNPPADRDSCVIPDVLPIATSVKTVMSNKSMKMDTPDGVVTRMEIAGGSPPAEVRISESPDRLQTVISVTSTEMAGGSPPADRVICESPEVVQRAGSVTAVVSEKWMERFVINPKVISLRTPATSQVIQAPRRAALTTTKVPRFDGTTSWEQYHQVFEAIVQSNSWDNDTAALQLFSHLEGDVLNVAHLVPLTRRLSRSGLVDALTAHYGSPGRLADYRRQFERNTRTVGEDPAIFATALETLAVKAFGDMGQAARLRLIRDRFIAGHSNCDLRRHLDSVSPETPIRDIVDRCRVWESHADPAVRRISKPMPDPIYPKHMQLATQTVTMILPGWLRSPV